MRSHLSLNDPEAIRALTLEFSDPEVDRPEPHHIRYKKGWRPKLNPIQGAAVASSAIYKLYYGERFSGKSYGGLHELVDYLYRNDNSLGYIIVKEIGIGTEGGAWDKLCYEVLPEWKEGLGIEFTDSRLDTKTKKPYIWISNRAGGWSMVMLASLPVPNQVEGKIRGREPQIIFVDEAQFLEGDVYFTALLMQLGRRTTVDGDPAKIVFACNPEGPSHWLYRRFFEIPVNQETGIWDDRYAKFHIPVSDNAPNLPPRYYEDYVLPAVANDPIAEARLVRGEWVDRPDGATLFGMHFSSEIHVRGSMAKNEGLMPVVGFPVIMSYDLGAAHSVIYFKQIIPTQTKRFKLTFDEFDFVGEYIPYPILVPQLVDRMKYWEDEMKTEFVWIHISDDSAINQYRPNTGSYDAWDVEKLSKEYIKQKGLPERFIIKMKGAPKGEHSREARARLAVDDLCTESTLISAKCVKLIEMMYRLPTDPDNPMAPKKKARYGHNFDAWSYADHYFNTRVVDVPSATRRVKSRYYAVGAR